ncbi:MAG: TetR/AcrR family transcriptional regulator [Candidatus Sumerlaeia bacterium]|nr:TetR/AcrR family transcriptional regulator [Candidatus Sumerlaeia bacterium]
MSSSTDSPRRGPSLRKRKSIEIAARKLFMARGFREVSMEEVAREANVSKATLYNHFPDKMALFANVVEQLRTSYIVKIPSNVAESIGHLEQFLHTFGVHLLDLLHGDELRTFNQMIGAYAHEMPELMKTIYEQGPLETQRRLGEAFSLAMEKGLLKPQDPMVVADQFLSLVRGVTFTEAMWGIHKPISAEIKLAHVKTSTAVILAAYRIDGGMESKG